MNVADIAGRLPLPQDVRRRLPVPTQQIAVVRLEGVITPAGAGSRRRGGITLEGLESTLKKAFDLPGLKAVALSISSPGGAPTQSALVADRIRGLAAEHEVPVIAFCEDVAASGGYWLACAADEIIAHPTSLVGSIGVVSGGFGLHEAIGRYGIERRLHTAGDNKARLDPFQPEQPEDVAWLRGELEQLHGLFTDWVRERRGDRLTGDESTLFSGEVWTGGRAKDLGLIDGLGTLRGVLGARWPEAKIVSISPNRNPVGAVLGMLSGASAAESATVPAMLRALEDRAAWARFGL
ncbi:S49 family peptidase [Patulibacter sp.]|uniref:S49 family peptidase n=1 Tax=Patulibacter sp. TaxID=1912859 RepID=UPI002718FFA1|nr:S49 family peptidase [Patulibacter sp.]MDO9409416.1 S49 family peptidase [Patulibacter sp.]